MIGHQQLDEAVAEQAVHDRSVIDHIVHIFSPEPAPAPSAAPQREYSAEVYHRIRRVWPEER